MSSLVAIVVGTRSVIGSSVSEVSGVSEGNSDSPTTPVGNVEVTIVVVEGGSAGSVETEIVAPVASMTWTTEIVSTMTTVSESERLCARSW